MLMRRFMILVILLALVACSTGKPQDEALELTKRSYLDANLGLTISIPADWDRKTVVPPEESTAPYSVLWKAPQGQSAASLQISVLPAGKLTSVASAALDTFSRSHPGFNLTARSLGKTGSWDTETALGHSSRLNYRVVNIAADQHIFQIVCSAPPEKFQHLTPLFNDIINSFQPLE